MRWPNRAVETLFVDFWGKISVPDFSIYRGVARRFFLRSSAAAASSWQPFLLMHARVPFGTSKMRQNLFALLVIFSAAMRPCDALVHTPHRPGFSRREAVSRGWAAATGGATATLLTTGLGKVVGSVTKRSSVLTTVVVVATPIALANRWIRVQTVGIAVVIS